MKFIMTWPINVLRIRKNQKIDYKTNTEAYLY